MTNTKYIKPRVWEEIVDLIYRMSDMAKSESKTIKCKANEVMIVVTPDSSPTEVVHDYVHDCHLLTEERNRQYRLSQEEN